MGRTDWGPIIALVVAVGGGVILWKKWDVICPKMFGEGSATCTGTPIDSLRQAAANAFNEFPTIAQNPTTSDYRSVRATGLTGSSPQIQAQFKKQAVQGQQAATNVRQVVAAKDKLSNKAENDAFCNGAFCQGHHTQCPKCTYKNGVGTWSGFTWSGFTSFNTITLNRIRVI